MPNIIEALQSRGLTMKKVSSSKGGEWAGPCPACGGRDRFRCWPEARGGGTYWCRQCQVKGDLLQFYRDIEGLDFKEAAERAGKPLLSRGWRSWKATPLPSCPAHQAGPGAASGGSLPQALASWRPHEPETPPARWQQEAGKFASWAAQRLQQTPALLQWLADRRGLRSETVARSGLGWNPGERGRDLYRPVTAWGLAYEVNAKGRERRLWLPLGLVMPNWTGGTLQRVKIRRPKRSDSLPPELAPAFEDGAQWARNAPFAMIRGSSDASFFLPGSGQGPAVVVVVEGELDALLLHQEARDLLGAGGGVLALGSASNRPDACAFALLRQARHVLVALDFDDTPEEAGEKAARSWWLPMFTETARRWPVPQGKDPCEAWLAGVDLRVWIQAALPLRPAPLRQRQAQQPGAAKPVKPAPLGRRPESAGPREVWL